MATTTTNTPTTLKVDQYDRVLVHEAGHMLAGYLLGYSVEKLEFAHGKGRVTFTNEYFEKDTDLAAIAAAGKVAEKLLGVEKQTVDMSNGRQESEKMLGDSRRIVALGFELEAVKHSVELWLQSHLEKLIHMIERIVRFLTESGLDYMNQAELEAYEVFKF